MVVRARVPTPCMGPINKLTGVFNGSIRTYYYEAPSRHLESPDGSRLPLLPTLRQSRKKRAKRKNHQQTKNSNIKPRFKKKWISKHVREKPPRCKAKKEKNGLMSLRLEDADDVCHVFSLKPMRGGKWESMPNANADPPRNISWCRDYWDP